MKLTRKFQWFLWENFSVPQRIDFQILSHHNDVCCSSRNVIGMHNFSTIISHTHIPSATIIIFRVVQQCSFTKSHFNTCPLLSQTLQNNTSAAPRRILQKLKRMLLNNRQTFKICWKIMALSAELTIFEVCCNSLIDERGALGIQSKSIFKYLPKIEWKKPEKQKDSSDKSIISERCWHCSHSVGQR